jgi:hypothetical protein
VTTKKLTAAASVIALAMSFATTAYANLECTDDCEPPPPVEETKGNNGWGNGPDSTNAGSFSGGTADTKSVNGLGVDKFDGKFEGR